MKKLVVFIFLFYFFLLTVSAQPPFEPTQTNPNGLIIAFPEFTYVALHMPFNFEFHVFNSSTGLQLDNTTTYCYTHIYSPNGTQVYSNTSTFDGTEFKNILPAEVIHTRGEYAYVTICNTTELGGFASGNFYVSTSGYVLLEENEASVIPMALIMIFFFLLGFLYSEKRWKLKMFFNVLGLLTALLIASFLTEFNGNNESLFILSLTFQIIMITIVSFYFAYMLIYYTLDVINQVKESKKRKRAEKSDPY